ncbi:MAG: NAD(P)/FAD-dependent oxidoreductase [bacterium]|nr:NAD(P)/FAD-dependent oxidoreductase [bacterium]
MPENILSSSWDIVVIGGGPAGLSAAVNAAVRNKKVLVLEHQGLCRKVAWAEKINNYLGLPAIVGKDLAAAYIRHFKNFDIPVLEKRAEMIAAVSNGFMVSVGTGDIRASAVILALGVTSQQTLPGEEHFLGRGVSYCATCDGPLYRGRDVAVLAYGHEAVEEANFLAEICRSVYLLKATDDISGLRPEVRIIDKNPQAIKGSDFVTHVIVEGEEVPVEAAFIMRPTLPAQRLLFGLETENGFIKVDHDLSSSVAGVWAAGDCTGKPHQISKAVGEGATAALNAVRYLDEKRPGR